jgi:hypothetical protein
MRIYLKKQHPQIVAAKIARHLVNYYLKIMTETKDSETADFLKKKIKLKKDDVEVVELQESLKSLYFKKRQRDYPNDDPPL